MRRRDRDASCPRGRSQRLFAILLCLVVSLGGCSAGYTPPMVWLFPGTKIALTLLNPDCNLDLNRKVPSNACGVRWFQR